MLKGIDVSQHQGSVDWQAVRRAGCDFAIVKATEGQDYVDPRFTAERVDAIRRVGLVLGVYHYLRPKPGRTGAVEIKHALKVAREAGWGKPGDLRLMIDIEETALDRAGTKRYLREAVEEYERQMGHRPGIYSFPAFLQGLQLDTTMKCPLWLAHFGVRTPTVPAPWEQETIWQYTSSGSVGGEQPVDVNEALRGEFAAARVPEPKPKPDPPKPRTWHERVRRRMRRARRKYLRTRSAKTLRVYLICKARLGIWDPRYCSYWGVDPNVSPAIRRFITTAYARGLVATSTTGGVHAPGSYHYQKDAQGRGRGADCGNRRPLIGTEKGRARMEAHQRHEYGLADQGRTRPMELLGPVNYLAILRGRRTGLAEGTSIEQVHDTHTHGAW